MGGQASWGGIGALAVLFGVVVAWINVFVPGMGCRYNSVFNGDFCTACFEGTAVASTAAVVAFVAVGSIAHGLSHCGAGNGNFLESTRCNGWFYWLVWCLPCAGIWMGSAITISSVPVCNATVRTWGWVAVALLIGGGFLVLTGSMPCCLVGCKDCCAKSKQKKATAKKATTASHSNPAAAKKAAAKKTAARKAAAKKAAARKAAMRKTAAKKAAAAKEHELNQTLLAGDNV